LFQKLQKLQAIACFPHDLQIGYLGNTFFDGFAQQR
jgi:hypothetical protein